MARTFHFRSNAQVREAMTPHERSVFPTDVHELQILDEDGGGYRVGLTTEQALDLVQQIQDSDLQ